jgi:hypothetical protein
MIGRMVTYEGELFEGFVNKEKNHTFEGYGRFIYEDGEYFIGYW